MTALIVYCVFAWGIQLGCAVICIWTTETIPNQRRNGARLMILLPFAPLLMLNSLIVFIAKMFKIADFGNKGKK